MISLIAVATLICCTLVFILIYWSSKNASEQAPLFKGVYFEMSGSGMKPFQVVCDDRESFEAAFREALEMRVQQNKDKQE